MEKSGAGALRVALSVLILYLAANALSGRQGLIAYVGLQAQEQKLLADGAALSAEIAALNARANRLRTAHIDKDFLEERARALLNASRPGEITLAMDGTAPIFE
jgi:cell division protein FtsB